MSTPRVALVSTATLDQPGSMRAYADTLLDALRRFAPEINTRLIELNPTEASGAWQRRAQSLLLPVKARQQRGAPPDVWHVLDGSRAYVAAGLRGAPVVITAHDVIPWLQSSGRFPNAPAIGAAARWLWRHNGVEMRRAAALVCVSENTRRDVIAAFATQRSASTVVPLALRPSLATLALDRRDVMREAGSVLHVGNNSFYKNRMQALRIFAQLNPALARKLVMVGSPPDAALRDAAEGWHIGNRIEWVGNLDDARLAEQYQRSSVMLFPSLYEGFGWPVLEAMAFGLPVVCSNAGSLPEVVDDAAPCVAVDDVAGFVRHAEQVLSDRRHAEAASASGVARASLFNAQRLAQQLQGVYENVLANHSRSGPK